jgi:hypothetical protein
MLYYSAIEPPVLELLKKLLLVPEFGLMYLAGGTSLALQIGHRKSVDLVLFGKLETDELFISKTLNSIGEARLINKSPNILIYSVNGIKLDLVNYHYPLLEEVLKIDSLYLVGKKDIAAMKLAAITGRGSKKDFVDIYFLLREFNLKEILDFYTRKFHDGSPFLVLKSLTWFDDADADPDPVMLKPAEWDKIKASLMKSVETYLTSKA